MNSGSLRVVWKKEFEAYNLCPFWTNCHDEDSKLVDADSGMERSRRRNPLPGYVGKNYLGVVVIGQNPAPTPSEWRDRDTALFNALDEGHGKGVRSFRQIALRYMKENIPQWKFMTDMAFGTWGIDIDEIAYLNSVKCATKNRQGKRSGAPPITSVRNRCMGAYLCQHLASLKPSLIIFRYSGVQSNLNAFLNSRSGDDPFYRNLSKWYNSGVEIIRFSGIAVSNNHKKENIPRIQRAVKRLRIARKAS